MIQASKEHSGKFVHYLSFSLRQVAEFIHDKVFDTLKETEIKCTMRTRKTIFEYCEDFFLVNQTLE